MLNSKCKISNFILGLTLIEILVSITIFSTVIGIITNITLDMIRAEAITASNQVALDNGRFILQRIAKAVRVSVIKTSDVENNIDSTIIKMDHPRRGTVEYFLDGDSRIVERIGEDPATDSFLDSSSVTVETFKFNIKGADDGLDYLQPQVTIIIKLKPPKAKNQELPSINIQTTLSQRCLDKSSSCQAI
ncbi:hypothetical protein D4R86_01560 [bacterium]|nr:MAG: hypothetical protein D4R86_01560 [bacterium]